MVPIPIGSNSAMLGCDGGFSIHGEEPERRAHFRFQRIGTRNLLGASLDYLLHSKEIDYLKIDVEGHEIEVLKGARNLFRKRLVANAIVELQPTYWNPPKADFHYQIFRDFIGYGYKISCPVKNISSMEIEHLAAEGCLDILISREKTPYPINLSIKPWGLLIIPLGILLLILVHFSLKGKGLKKRDRHTRFQQFSLIPETNSLH